MKSSKDIVIFVYYNNYIDYYASWNNAMFNYDFTIGYRLINSKNKLSEKFAKINSLGFRSEEFEEKKIMI